MFLFINMLFNIVFLANILVLITLSESDFLSQYMLVYVSYCFKVRDSHFCNIHLYLVQYKKFTVYFGQGDLTQWRSIDYISKDN